MEKKPGGRGGRHTRCFYSLELEGLKDPTKCNSIFVYWFFFDKLLKLHELERKLRVPGHLLKRQMCLAMCCNQEEKITCFLDLSEVTVTWTELLVFVRVARS